MSRIRLISTNKHLSFDFLGQKIPPQKPVRKGKFGCMEGKKRGRPSTNADRWRPSLNSHSLAICKFFAQKCNYENESSFLIDFLCELEPFLLSLKSHQTGTILSKLGLQSLLIESEISCLDTQIGCLNHIESRAISNEALQIGSLNHIKGLENVNQSLQIELWNLYREIEQLKACLNETTVSLKSVSNQNFLWKHV